MKTVIQKAPIPLCGVALGTAALGNLLQDMSEAVRMVCGAIAGLLLIVILLKLTLFPAAIKEDMKNPIMACVAGTFPMALMILSTYLQPMIGRAAFFLWAAAILLHVILMIYFMRRFILKLQMERVFASYYIVYVGIAVAAVTAPVYGKQEFGRMIFWFAFFAFLSLTILITARYLRYRKIPDPAKPLLCIYAAPMSLCIVAYMKSVEPKVYSMLIVMFAAACVLYLFALIKAIGYLRLPFYPSYASFTFPFVISATASKEITAYLVQLGYSVPVLHYVVMMQTLIAVILVGYTLVRFLLFFMMRE